MTKETSTPPKEAINYLGPSSDLRTNRWRVPCPHCNKAFEPRTTMFASEFLDCPKCKKELFVHYNNQTVEAAE